MAWKGLFASLDPGTTSKSQGFYFLPSKLVFLPGGSARAARASPGGEGCTHPLLLTSWSHWRRPRGQWRGPARCSLQPFPSTGTALGRPPALWASRGDALKGGHWGPVRRRERPAGWGRMPGPRGGWLTAGVTLVFHRHPAAPCSQHVTQDLQPAAVIHCRAERGDHRQRHWLPRTDIGVEQNPGSLGRGCWITRSLRSGSSPTAVLGQNRGSSSPVARLRVQSQ